MWNIILLIGFVLSIIAAIEILMLKGNLVKRIIFAILVWITGWIGLLVYYLWARGQMPGWVK
ncbi:MAG: hypothetical protein LBN29_07470 [Mediterranea sp.]|jgi:hypothetical protein|nr:hypothetical protein [Mediterranea sp.]